MPIARSRVCVRAAVNVSDETFGQARGKAEAVEGDCSLVIEFDDDHDRRIGMRFRVVARVETERPEIVMLRADCKYLPILMTPSMDRPPDRRTWLFRTYKFWLQSGATLSKA
jgi:hypothetical protein